MEEVNKKQLEEVMNAYSDCNDRPGERDLAFSKKDLALTGRQLFEVSKACCPNGYNEFDVDAVIALVELFGDNADYYMCRESSVCVYVRPKNRIWLNRGVKIEEVTRSDEFSFEPDGTFRVWWD